LSKVFIGLTAIYLNLHPPQSLSSYLSTSCDTSSLSLVDQQQI